MGFCSFLVSFRGMSIHTYCWKKKKTQGNGWLILLYVNRKQTGLQGEYHKVTREKHKESLIFDKLPRIIRKTILRLFTILSAPPLFSSNKGTLYEYPGAYKCVCVYLHVFVDEETSTAIDCLCVIVNKHLVTYILL